jgi:glutaconate CoA-transferase subunit A
MADSMPTPSQRLTSDEVVAREVKDGMTVGIGGWGARRKPMALVRALARCGARDLTVVSFGGPDLGLLCATGQVRRAVYGFVSLDSIPLEPHFRAARQRGALAASELDEGMLYLGLQAAAWRVPFLPTRAGLGSDVLRLNPELRTVRSPYGDAEELVAMPALELDLALVHVNHADRFGSCALLGPDPYFDDLFLMAARRRIVSCERVLTAEELARLPLEARRIHRAMVDHVVEAPLGAHPTECPPDYARDEQRLREYAAAAEDPAATAAWLDRWVAAPHAEYVRQVRA